MDFQEWAMQHPTGRRRNNQKKPDVTPADIESDLPDAPDYESNAEL